jgi:hypothetical protein
MKMMDDLPSRKACDLAARAISGVKAASCEDR